MKGNLNVFASSDEHLIAEVRTNFDSEIYQKLTHLEIQKNDSKYTIVKNIYEFSL